MDGPLVHRRHLKKNMGGVELLALVAIIAFLPALHSKIHQKVTSIANDLIWVR